MSDTHITVLRSEAVDQLVVVPGKKYIDATLGGGGHGLEIVRRGGILLGIDTDTQAIQIARKHLEQEREKNWTIAQGNFRDVEEIANTHGFTQVSGVLFDLGVSSFQLDTPERGFSYRFTDAPLDLRMNQSSGDTAAQLVNRASEEELYEIFANLGEEQFSRPIARALCRARTVNPIETTGDLVAVIAGAVSDTKHGVLSRIFQALRMEVNDELGSIKKGLDGAKNVLEQNGKLVVISFHSLEDRLIKQYMRTNNWSQLTKHPIVPTDEEQGANKRSRSAKMRTAVKL